MGHCVESGVEIGLGFLNFPDGGDGSYLGGGWEGLLIVEMRRQSYFSFASHRKYYNHENCLEMKNEFSLLYVGFIDTDFDFIS